MSPAFVWVYTHRWRRCGESHGRSVYSCTICQFSDAANWRSITPGPKQVFYAADGYPGGIYELTLDGKVLGVLGKSGHGPGQFGWIHELACPNENVLFAAELLNWRVQKLTLVPTR